MANVIQSETAPQHMRPFTGYQGRPGEPIATLVHTQDVLAVDLVAAGNTAGLRLSLPLPIDYAYRLINGVATIRGDQSGRWQWPHLVLYFATHNGLAPNLTTELDLPMASSYNVDAAQEQKVTFTMGGGVVDSAKDAGSSNDGSPASKMLVYGHSGVQPNFEMSEPTASTNAATISYLFQWMVYEIENSLNSRLFWFDGIDD